MEGLYSSVDVMEKFGDFNSDRLVSRLIISVFKVFKFINSVKLGNIIGLLQVNLASKSFESSENSADLRAFSSPRFLPRLDDGKIWQFIESQDWWTHNTARRVILSKIHFRAITRDMCDSRKAFRRSIHELQPSLLHWSFSRDFAPAFGTRRSNFSRVVTLSLFLFSTNVRCKSPASHTHTINKLY